jgi:hypothetical protein
MNKPDFPWSNLRAGCLLRPFLALASLLAFLPGADSALGQEPSPSKYQVEAVFLFNFAKFVEWPVAAFPAANAPIIIGVMGTDPFGDSLPHIIEGKMVNGRPFLIKHLAADSPVGNCHILFVSHSEASRMSAILGQAGALPVLTVGEDDSFARNGGIINFVLKNDKVRLEIDLAAARKAGVAISSKLLAVADVVKGKPD